MPLALRPFPVFYRPPSGQVDALPSTRNGVHLVPPKQLTASAPGTFAELKMKEQLTGCTSRGICGLVPASAFSSGTIRPHESTLAARLARQKKLVTEDRGALGKPVLITADDLTGVWQQLAKNYGPTGAETSFYGTDTDYWLREFALRGNRSTTGLDLSKLNGLAIADGHHRAETHARLAATGRPEFRQVPVCIVAARELSIGIFLRQLNDFSGPVQDLLSQLAAFFTVSEIARPVAPTDVNQWLMTYRGKHYQLTRRTGDDNFTTPMAWMVQVVLKEIFGIENASTDPRLTNEPVDTLPNGLLDLKDASVLTFAGSAVTPELFFAEIAANRLLPPKSTRFMPRVPSGLVVWRGSLP
ncbi:DUF1015 family protein [Neolewinella antarctica]|uniref:Uncharacterized protein (DUF1015 family) n=1 Tax=Neolewinella antarctica TaxID=442734 RepID=A0ABX0X7H7_9BACT|nr:DUF1015 family protein [Neolewinella antarctica]NJC24958.1 uncharacterized protein (DUF1015 family) [Neolewinella antarctica]